MCKKNHLDLLIWNSSGFGIGENGGMDFRLGLDNIQYDQLTISMFILIPCFYVSVTCEPLKILWT